MQKFKMNLQMTTSESLPYEVFRQSVLFHEDTAGVENKVINVYPELQYETFEGFGRAITDSAAYVYSKMTAEQKKTVIETYFSPDQMKYGLVRIHMDSCDFSLEQYEALSDPSDKKLDGFSFERTEKYILPMLEDASRAANGKLKLMLSPWSPPSFMKTNQRRELGGSLKPEYREMWTEYICRYIEEFVKRGYEVQRISLQNEPKAVQTWDSCVYTAEEEKVFLRDLYPEKKLILSESCLEYRCFDQNSIQKNAGKLAHEVIGDLSHGMSAFYDWNLLLDEKGGPNHVGSYCHAPYLYDIEKKQLMPQKTLEYFYHFSHYIVPGSVRIATSRYTDFIETVAYETPDQEIVLVILNRSEATCPVSVRMNGQVAEIILQADSITTCVIGKEEN